ncbi:DH domain-containing protein, variant 2 [Balamuthia mandrillaris]
MRQESIKELVNTEGDYVRDLEIMIEVFYRPLQEKNLLSRQELSTLFSNAEAIVGVSQEILKHLEKNVGTDGSYLVGKTFLELVEFIKMYTVYCGNQPVALSTLDKCKASNTAFAAFLNECMSDPRCRGLNLFSFLIKPIQRVCKYPLLLKELLKHTPETHEDYADLVEAMTQVTNVVEHVNEFKRKAENDQKIIELQTAIEGGQSLGLVTPTRRLLREESLEVIFKKGKRQSRKCVLFNDMLLCLKERRSGGYESPNFVQLQNIKFTDVSDMKDIKNAIELLEEKNKMMLLFPSSEMKNEWAGDIKAIVKFYMRRKFLESQGKSGADLPLAYSPNSPRLERGSSSRDLSPRREVVSLSPLKKGSDIVKSSSRPATMGPTQRRPTTTTTEPPPPPSVGSKPKTITKD